jgi:AcrR family transcriptional regulator
MPTNNKHQRNNQRLRTRKDLLQAAARLIKNGKMPTMDEIADEALVSRATAYRYFPSLDALLVEAPLDGVVPEPGDLFLNDKSTDPEQRLDKAEAALHEMIYRNEPQLRLMLANSISSSNGKGEIPIRQNRRQGLIEAALAPAKNRFSKSAYKKLCAALAVFFGSEAMIVFRDVFPLDQQTARSTKSWAIRALVRAALQESKAKH